MTSTRTPLTITRTRTNTRFRTNRILRTLLRNTISINTDHIFAATSRYFNDERYNLPNTTLNMAVSHHTRARGQLRFHRMTIAPRRHRLQIRRLTLRRCQHHNGSPNRRHHFATAGTTRIPNRIRIQLITLLPSIQLNTRMAIITRPIIRTRLLARLDTQSGPMTSHRNLHNGNLYATRVHHPITQVQHSNSKLRFIITLHLSRTPTMRRQSTIWFRRHRRTRTVRGRLQFIRRHRTFTNGLTGHTHLMGPHRNSPKHIRLTHRRQRRQPNTNSSRQALQLSRTTLSLRLRAAGRGRPQRNPAQGQRATFITANDGRRLQVLSLLRAFFAVRRRRHPHTFNTSRPVIRTRVSRTKLLLRITVRFTRRFTVP